MKFNQNIIKGWITSIVGVCVYVVTTILWLTNVIPMKWEGVLGYLVGTFLLLAPDKIISLTRTYITKKQPSANAEDEPTN